MSGDSVWCHDEPPTGGSKRGAVMGTEVAWPTGGSKRGAAMGAVMGTEVDEAVSPRRSGP